MTVWKKYAVLMQECPPVLFATVSGAHLYGFESPDSDVDLRGVFVRSAEEVLGLFPPEETISVSEMREDLELDFVAHDLLKFARLMTKNNGYVLEQLFSPLVVVGGERHAELKEIAKGLITRHQYHHYRGFSSKKIKEALGADGTVKSMLYAFRTLLTGLYLLRTGTVEANLVRLSDEYSMPELLELVEKKRSDREKDALPTEEAERWRPLLEKLAGRLDEAFETSNLPEEASTTRELSEFVTRVRLEGMHE